MYRSGRRGSSTELLLTGVSARCLVGVATLPFTVVKARLEVSDWWYIIWGKMEGEIGENIDTNLCFRP